MFNKLKKVVIIGAGGFGRETLDIFDACNAVQPEYDVLGYIVQKEYSPAGVIINDKPVLGDFDWLEEHHLEVQVICGVGPPHHRLRLISMAEKIGCQFISIIHPSVIRTRWVSIGEGSIIAAGCILTNQICIGRHVQINLDCTIGHDALVSDFVTLSPGVHVSGNVTIGAGCSVGTGANIIEKLTLGEWSVIGAGSTLVSDVPANTTVVGVPGKVIKTHPEGWQLA